VDADLDTLATALYITADELLKTWPDLARARPAVGNAPPTPDRLRPLKNPWTQASKG
jgi:hypothetical protein